MCQKQMKWKCLFPDFPKLFMDYWPPRRCNLSLDTLSVQITHSKSNHFQFVYITYSWLFGMICLVNEVFPVPYIFFEYLKSIISKPYLLKSSINTHPYQERVRKKHAKKKHLKNKIKRNMSKGERYIILNMIINYSIYTL